MAVIGHIVHPQWCYLSYKLTHAPPGWLSGERVGVEANFLSGVFSPLTSAEACVRKVVGGFGKKSCVSTGARKQETHVRHRPP